MPHLYTFRYRLNNEVSGLENLEGRLTIGNWISDSIDHLTLKLLSYFMFYDPEIKIDVDIDSHYKPDLVVEGEHYQPKLWVECGKIELRKLDKVATKCNNCSLFVVKKGMRSLEHYFNQAKKRVKRIERVEFVGFERDYIDDVGEIILNSQRRTIDLYCYITEDHITTIFNETDEKESDILKLRV